MEDIVLEWASYPHMASTLDRLPRMTSGGSMYLLETREELSCDDKILNGKTANSIFVAFAKQEDQLGDQMIR